MNKRLANRLATVINDAFIKFERMEEYDELFEEAWRRTFKDTQYPYLNNILHQTLSEISIDFAFGLATGKFYIESNSNNSRIDIISDILGSKYIQSDASFIEKECKNANIRIDKDAKDIPVQLAKLDEYDDKGDTNNE